jgi:hypothetical protein
MKKILLVSIAFIWIGCLIILIIALTDLYPNNIFQEYQLLIGIAFISITGLLRIIFNKITVEQTKKKQNSII